MNKNQNSLKNKAKETTEAAKEKTQQATNSSVWQKTKEVAQKATTIVGSHLAATKTALTLSNAEAELMESLKQRLSQKGVYPSKDEILRAALWSFRNKSEAEMEAALKDLVNVKRARVL